MRALVQVRRKMSREEFVRLVPSAQVPSNDSPGLFDRKALEAIYDDVLSSEFRLLFNEADIVSQSFMIKVLSYRSMGVCRNCPNQSVPIPLTLGAHNRTNHRAFPITNSNL